MRMRNVIFATGFFLLLSCSANAADNRSFCKRFAPNMNLSSCISQQDAAERRMHGNTYEKSVVDTCTSRARIVDRAAAYTDFVSADSCASQEQRRVNEERESRAHASRDRAASKYLNEASRTESAYRKKYYHK